MITSQTEPITAALSDVEEANYATIEAVLPEWASQRIPGIVTFYTDNITWHPIPEGRVFRGKAEVAEFFERFFHAIPDMDFVLLTKISRGNFISEEFRMRGTQRGDYFGIPATNRPVELYGMSMARWQGAKLHADEFIFDSMTMMTQLGVFPRALGPTSRLGQPLLRLMTRLAGDQGSERQPSIHLAEPGAPQRVRDIETVVDDSNPLTPTEEQNQAAIDELFAALNAGDVRRVQTLCAPDAVVRYVPSETRLVGPAGIQEGADALRAMFPDLQLDLVHRIVRGDTVAALWAVRGTHEGDCMGVPATGRAIDLPGMTMFTVQDGRIATANVYLDAGMLLRQLGVMPPLTFGSTPAGRLVLSTLVRRMWAAGAVAGLAALLGVRALARRR